MFLLFVFIPLVASRVVVFTVGDEEKDGFKRMRKSAEQHGVTFEVMKDEGSKKCTNREFFAEGSVHVLDICEGGGDRMKKLRDAVVKYKDEEDTLIVYTEGGENVLWTDGIAAVEDRMKFEFREKRIVFSSDIICWPDPGLSLDYPLVQFGKRFINSGMFVGYARELHQLLTLKNIADSEDSQLFYTMLYLDEEFRKQFKIGVDSTSFIFQNLNGVTEEVKLEFDEGSGYARAHNTVYNTHPIILNGNQKSRLYLNYLSNYLNGQWTTTEGCVKCERRSETMEDRKIVSDHPIVLLSVIVSRPTPFLEEILEKINELEYPKKSIHLYVYNSQHLHANTIGEWVSRHQNEFLSTEVIGADSGKDERNGRQHALDKSIAKKVEYLFLVDSEHFFSSTQVIDNLIDKLNFYDLNIIAPFMNQPGKYFSNFWGALAENGYYARSEDYYGIVEGTRSGYWNVPYISGPFLIRASFIPQVIRPFHYNLQVEADMSFCQYARENGIFLHIDNEEHTGFLVMREQFEKHHGNKLHPEMWQIFENRHLWESRYLHPSYASVLKEEIPEPCRDVYEFPLLTERFCQEMIEEMENFGQWSDGTNNDKRLKGGYESVPTRDIHMNQIGFEKEWLYFLDEFARPVQEKVYKGYYHKPVEADMMFVVRYRPDEQPSLRPHLDASTYSLDVALNRRGKDYQGGRVRFIRYNCTVDAEKPGYAIMFPGRITHLHEAFPTTEGTRYVLISFINP